jgi:3-methyladenine DNA glycosylase Tag
MTPFSTILARAEQRKGGPEALARLLPPPPSKPALIALGDDRILAEMTRRVFSAGFVWSVIDAKWAGFEAAFLSFDPAALAFQPDEFWEGLASDTRIIRNGAKIMAARHNAVFVQEVSREHGGFGRFLAEWPSSNQLGLMDDLAKRGSRLGGATGLTFLRFIGWDGFMLSRDVVACLRESGLDIAEEPKSKGDLAKIQAQFNAWAEESGLSYLHLSRICAMSAGVNYEPERLMQYMGGGEET